MKIKGRIKDFAYFLASYSFLGILILLTIVLGFRVDLNEIINLALHGEYFINISCIFMLISVIVFPVTLITHIFLTMTIYHKRGGENPYLFVFLKTVMYVFHTLCWKPYKGLDLFWLLKLPKESAHDRKYDFNRWLPRFFETLLWWGIISAVAYTILHPGNNSLLVAIRQFSNRQILLILLVSLAIVIVASMFFALLERLFDHIRAKIFRENVDRLYSRRDHWSGSKPFACTACGGPYPLCRDSCPLYDD